MKPGIGTRLPKPPAFKNGRPCSAYWGEKMADDKPPAYGATAPYTVCGYAPDQLRSAYGVSDAIESGIDGTGQTVAVIDAFASPTIERDLRKYSDRHGLPAADLTQYNAPITPGSDIGNQQGWWGEETLDLEAVHSLAPGATLVYLGARDNSGRGLLERFEFAVDGELAQIISNSYGTLGEKIAPSGFAAWEAVFQQAAAMGIGSYFSSGDCGDNKDPDGLCGGTGYITTDYSASSPWVTSVGGTSLGVGDQGQYLFETGWGTTASYLGNNRWTPAPPGQYRYGSGGGTSGLFAEPSYQVGVVPDALATRWNGRNRVVPDVAAVGDPHHGLPRRTDAGVRTRSALRRVSDRRKPACRARCSRRSWRSPIKRRGATMDSRTRLSMTLLEATRSATSWIRRRRWRRFGADFANGVNPHDGLVFTLRSLNQTGTLDTTPGYDDVTGLGSPNGEAFLDAMS